MLILDHDIIANVDRISVDRVGPNELAIVDVDALVPAFGTKGFARGECE